MDMALSSIYNASFSIQEPKKIYMYVLFTNNIERLKKINIIQANVADSIPGIVEHCFS